MKDWLIIFLSIIAMGFLIFSMIFSFKFSNRERTYALIEWRTGDTIYVSGTSMKVRGNSVVIRKGNSEYKIFNLNLYKEAWEVKENDN
jgi:uncharacterized protein YpmS